MVRGRGSVEFLEVLHQKKNELPCKLIWIRGSEVV